MTFCGFPATSERSRPRIAMHPARVELAAAVDDWYVPVCVVLQHFLLTVRLAESVNEDVSMWRGDASFDCDSARTAPSASSRGAKRSSESERPSLT